MKSFSQNLVSIMDEKKIKASELSAATGISKARISQYTHGLYVPKAEAMDKIAHALGVSRDRLCGRPAAALPYKKLQILGEIACGIPIWANQEDGECVFIDSDIDADFALVAKGDSMKDARILGGDIVFLKKCDMVNNGDIAAVIINDEATLKRVYYYPELKKIMLIPENSKYEPLIFLGEDIEQIRIIGKAVGFRSYLS